MVKLRYVFGPAVAMVVLVAALPITRDALVYSSIWHGDWFDDLPLGVGLVEGEQEPAITAWEIGEPWALLAGAEVSWCGSSRQRALLLHPAAEDLTEPALRERRAGLLLGLAVDDDEVDLRLLDVAEQAVQELVAAHDASGYAWLLAATVAVERLRWDEAERALSLVPEAELRLPHLAAAHNLARLLRANGEPELEARAWGSEKLNGPDLGAMRRMARAVADRAHALRAAGREQESLKLAMTLARAGRHLRRGETAAIPAHVGMAIEAIAYRAGEPQLEAPEALRETSAAGPWQARERARRLAVRLRTAGMRSEADEVVNETEGQLRVKQALREDRRDGQGLGPVNRPLAWVVCWANLPLALVMVFYGLAAWSLLPALLAPRGAKPLAWRWGELAVVLAVVLPAALAAAVWCSWSFFERPQETALLHAAWVKPLLLALATSPLATLCLWLGILHGRRAVRRPGWRRCRESLSFAGRAMMVPLLACLAMFLIVAASCGFTTAYYRHRAAQAFDDLPAHQAQVLAQAGRLP